MTRDSVRSVAISELEEGYTRVVERSVHIDMSVEWISSNEACGYASSGRVKEYDGCGVWGLSFMGSELKVARCTRWYGQWSGAIILGDGVHRPEEKELNKLTVKNRYLLPTIDDLLDQLQGLSVYFEDLNPKTAATETHENIKNEDVGGIVDVGYLVYGDFADVYMHEPTIQNTYTPVSDNMYQAMKKAILWRSSKKADIATVCCLRHTVYSGVEIGASLSVEKRGMDRIETEWRSGIMGGDELWGIEVNHTTDIIDGD
ncbi:hypothetical protein Tco_1031165 [Tanacetum coccineum]|uniref:Uncharacterized protein n=1 Tax=Tanacetum coccineum TaxID=301880 RepID=A0ABQ5G915_9ASTR